MVHSHYLYACANICDMRNILENKCTYARIQTYTNAYILTPEDEGSLNERATELENGVYETTANKQEYIKILQRDLNLISSKKEMEKKILRNQMAVCLKICMYVETHTHIDILFEKPIFLPHSYLHDHCILALKSTFVRVVFVCVYTLYIHMYTHSCKSFLIRVVCTPIPY
jgi:hypothetical protein